MPPRSSIKPLEVPSRREMTATGAKDKVARREAPSTRAAETRIPPPLDAASRGLSQPLLANVAGGRSGEVDNGRPETWLPTPLRLLPPSSRALPLSDHSQKGGGVRADPRGNFLPPEEGSSRSSELSFPWVLLALISCAKETRRMAAHHQSQSLEQVSITDALQDGVQRVSDSSPAGRRLHDVD